MLRPTAKYAIALGLFAVSLSSFSAVLTAPSVIKNLYNGASIRVDLEFTVGNPDGCAYSRDGLYPLEDIPAEYDKLYSALHVARVNKQIITFARTDAS